MSRRETVIAAVVTALNTGTPGGVPAAERLRRRQYDAGVASAITVWPVREEVAPASNRHGVAVQRSLVLAIECRVQNDAPDTALDPLTEWVVAALPAALDLVAGVLDVVEQRTEFDFAQREEGFGLATVEVQVNYLTRRDNLATI